MRNPFLTLLTATVPPRYPAQRADVLDHEVELRPPAPDREARVGEHVDTGTGELGEDAHALARAVGNDGVAVVDLSHSVRHGRLLVEVGIPVVGDLWGVHRLHPLDVDDVSDHADAHEIGAEPNYEHDLRTIHEHRDGACAGRSRTAHRLRLGCQPSMFTKRTVPRTRSLC
jgi:hypothetical protein